MRPVYHVYQIYQRFGDQLVYASCGDPDLSIYAALNDAGALTAVVINLAPEETPRTLDIEGFAPSEAQVWLFDPDHAAELIGSGSLDERIALPGQSMTLYVLKP